MLREVAYPTTSPDLQEISYLHPGLLGDPIRKQRFEREAKSVSSLNHPNICVLYDVGRQDGLDYLVMECIEGESRGPL